MAWYHRLRNVFRSARVQRDIDRELAFHIAERVDELRASGMNEDDAARYARRQLGNLAVHRERTREADLARWLEVTLRDVRYAVRTLARAPVFTSSVILTLALAIGANSAVFSAIDAVLLRPLPFPEGDRLMSVRHSQKNQWPPVAPTRLLDWSKLNSTFQALSGYYAQDSSELSGELPENLRHAFVAPRFLEVWGVAPALGRDFSPDEERFGGPKAALISDRYWRRHFGADPNAVGRQLRIGASSFEIIGIMPATFLFPDRQVDIWSPSPLDAPFAQHRGATWFNVIGRLKPGKTPAQAQADLAIVQSNLGKRYPQTDADKTVAIAPLKDALIGHTGRSLWMLFASVSVLLLIACTNIATLLLSRGAERQHEIAVRLSLGASRAMIIRRFLAESLLLALAGATLGLALAAASPHLFRGLAANLPRIDEVRLDWSIVVYSLVCALAATLLCGLYPAVRATRRDLPSNPRAGGRTEVSGHGTAHLALVGVQVSLAVALLLGAGLLVRSFHKLGRVSPGFDPANVLTMQISATWAETGTKDMKQRTQQLLEHLENVPGVDAAAITIINPPGVPMTYQHELKIEGRADSEPAITAESRYVSSGYFATMRIPLVAGEVCPAETSADVATAMVNRSFVNAYLSDSTVVGRRVRQANLSKAAEIRGIVGDARESGVNRLPAPTVYWCGASAQPGTIFLVRARGEATAMAETLRRKIYEIEPRRSVFGVIPLEELISNAFSENRLRTFLLAFFAAAAVLLACVGLYGTLSYLVSARRREIGLRLALGALRGQIVSQFVKQGLAVSMLACAAGLMIGVAFTRMLAGMLYGVSPLDGTTLAGVVIIVLVVAIAASLFPAIRAARFDPVQTLRNE